MMGLAPRSERGGTGFDPADFGGYGPNSRGDRYGVLEPMDAIAEQRARTQRQNEQIQRDREEMQQRIRMQTELLMHARREVFYGKDLKPCLTPAGEEYSKLHPRQPVNELPFGRNYMAGLGLWLSRVGWEQQMAGEHPYGYANNNPTAVFDPSGLSPCPMLGDDPCDQYPHVPGYWDKQESVRHLLTCRRSPQTLGVETDRWSSCFPFSIENRHSLGC